MKYNFFAFISRMRYINRWGLMRNSILENIEGHSFQTSVLAHALGVINNTYLGGNVDANRLAVIALYHDAPEIITGDLPTPVKYFSAGIVDAYDEVEKTAKNKLISKLPQPMSDIYKEIFDYGKTKDDIQYKLVKAADTLSALIKCIEEQKAGNTEFDSAKKAIYEKLISYELEEVRLFMELFIDGYYLPLDDQE